jgi:16S rRNA (guanine527-N7)-methyltransferase
VTAAAGSNLGRPDNAAMPNRANTKADPGFDPRAEVLRSGMAALAMRASDDTVSRLLAYLDLLHRWNQAYNLSAVRDPQQMVTQHLLDCLAALPPAERHLQTHLPSGGARVLDVGSGAGLPGVAWALMRPVWQLTCVDAVGKKAGFIRQAAAELRIKNLRSEHARVEKLPPAGADLVVSRAFSSLADFCALTHRHLAPGGCWLAMKGRVPADEMAALPAEVEVFHVEQLSVPGLDAQRCLVWMRPRAAAPGARVGAGAGGGADAGTGAGAGGNLG